MKVRAKFVCESVTLFPTSQSVQFRASYETGGNVDWSKYTPTGSLTMAITNEALYNKFTPGKSYYLDITEVE